MRWRATFDNLITQLSTFENLDRFCGQEIRGVLCLSHRKYRSAKVNSRTNLLTHPVLLLIQVTTISRANELGVHPSAAARDAIAGSLFALAGTCSPLHAAFFSRLLQLWQVRLPATPPPGTHTHTHFDPWEGVEDVGRAASHDFSRGCSSCGRSPMVQGRSTKIFSIIKWIRTSRLSIKSSLCAAGAADAGPREDAGVARARRGAQPPCTGVPRA